MSHEKTERPPTKTARETELRMRELELKTEYEIKYLESSLVDFKSRFDSFKLAIEDAIEDLGKRIDTTQDKVMSRFNILSVIVIADLLHIDITLLARIFAAAKGLML